jgi:hypothetical protein
MKKKSIAIIVVIVSVVSYGGYQYLTVQKTGEQYLTPQKAASSESNCNSEAILNGWIKGVKEREPIENIVAEFDPEYQEIVSYVDSISVHEKRSSVLGELDGDMTIDNTIGPMKHYQWTKEGENDELAVDIKFWYDCVYSIGILQSGNFTFYSKRTEFTSTPPSG